MMTQDYWDTRRIYRDRLLGLRERERTHLSDVDFALFASRFDPLIANIEAELRKLEPQSVEDQPSAVWVDMLFPSSQRNLELFELDKNARVVFVSPGNWLNTVFSQPSRGSVDVSYYATGFQPVYQSGRERGNLKPVLTDQPGKYIPFARAQGAVVIGVAGPQYSLLVENQALRRRSDLTGFVSRQSA